MAAEQAVVTGLGIVFFGLSWLGFRLNDNEDELLSQYAGVLLIALALAVLNTVGWVTMQIVLNEGTINYLGTAVVEPIMWSLNIALFIFWAVLLIRSLIYMGVAAMKWAGRVMGREVA